MPTRRSMRLVAATIAVIVGSACTGTGTGTDRPTARPRVPTTQAPPSATPVHDVQVKEAIEYASADGVELLLDVYRPSDPDRTMPCVLVIHGGGFRLGNRTELAPAAERLAANGFVAFAIDYRLAPPGGRWRWPAGMEHAYAAAAWVRANGDGYGCDTDRIGALGASAGANLALLLGTAPANDANKIDAVVSWSAPTALGILIQDRADPRVHEILENYIGCSFEECRSRWEDASPYHFAGPGDAPTLLANSTEEQIPLEQATLMRARLAAGGVPVEMKIFPGRAHGTGYSTQVWPATLDFFRRYLS